MRSWRPGLQAAIRDLDPGYFALVMATGIVSKTMSLDGAAALSGFLLGVAIAAYLALAAAYAWRLAAYRRELLADARDPRRAFGFFTCAAAPGVLAAASWLLLSYSVPLLAGRDSEQPVLAGVNGTWFLWAVAAQSVAVAATSLPPPVPGALAALAVGCWAVGVVLYFLITALAAGALLAYPVRPAGLIPAYWVAMGATAVSVLAGAQILTLPPRPLTAAVHGVVAGLSVVLWAFGTWLIPLLLVLGVWRHLLHRVPLRYDPGLWSIVFPVGMYGAASHELGAALDAGWLVTLGRYEAWVALVMWAVIAAAMAGALARRGAATAAAPNL